jgi:hypothetical protein
MAYGYEANLQQAERHLQWAEQNMQRLQDAGQILRGVIPRRDGDYEGWLVRGGRGGEADRAFSAWVRAKADVEHWKRLLLLEQGAPCDLCSETERLMRAPLKGQLRAEQIDELRSMRGVIQRLADSKSEPKGDL